MQIYLLCRIVYSSKWARDLQLILKFTKKKKKKMDKQRISKYSKMIATAESTWWVYLFARVAIAEYLSG